MRFEMSIRVAVELRPCKTIGSLCWWLLVSVTEGGKMVTVEYDRGRLKYLGSFGINTAACVIVHLASLR